MSLKDTIMNDIKAAMRSKDKETLSVLRFLHAQIKNKEVDERKTLTDQDIVAVIMKLVKQRKDGIQQFSDAGRMDLADKEKVELEMLQNYLPAQLSEDEVEKLVDGVIAGLNTTSIKDMGKVMKAVLEKGSGQIDGKVVSALVKSRLN